MNANATRAATAVLLIATLGACGGSAASSSEDASTAREPRSSLAAGHQRLAPGTYLLDPGRGAAAFGLSDPPKLEITVPSGWRNFDGWALHKGRQPDTVFVTFWDVGRVYSTPCKWKHKPMVDPGPSVAGLASALAAQPLRKATAPTDAVLGGARGRYLQWSVPTDIAFDKARSDKALFPDCDEKTFQSWTGAPG